MRNRRAPLVAGIAGGLVVLLAVLLLALPKRTQVSDARRQLEQVQSETSALQSQLRVLEDARANAPAARADIQKTDVQVPPSVNLPVAILMLRSAAEHSGVDFTDIAISTPTTATNGPFSSIPITMTLDGTYFSLAEFAFRIETLPRAAKALTASISPGTGGSTITPASNELTMQFSMELYTSDTSAGPGSVPGPSTGSVGA